MYELLGQIYKEILEIFDTDVVHMGGDEVRYLLWLDFPCNVVYIKWSSFFTERKIYFYLLFRLISTVGTRQKSL